MSVLQIISIVISLALTVVAVGFTAVAVKKMLSVIRIGQPASRSNNPGARTVTMLKETFLHTRMLQWTWVGILHWFAFAAFIVLSTAVMAAYGQLFDAHFVIPVIGEWAPYIWIGELLGLLGTLAIIPLIVYRVRNRPSAQGRQSRFFGSTMWQAYFVEAMVLLESSAILFIRGAEYKLMDGDGWHFPISQFFSVLYPDSPAALENIIYVIAMIKIASAMIWLLMISTHLTMGVAWHRFTAWFNIWFKRESDGSTALGAMKPLTVDGKPVTMDDIEDLDEDSALGVGKLEDFSWKGILDFTTCTECGRCQSQCPAWNTDKPLSPKLLIMALREATYAQAGASGPATTTEAAEGGSDVAVLERPLVGKSEQAEPGEDIDWFYNPTDGAGVIDPDVLWSCTSCGACVQQCPVDIEHVDHIMDMRRYQILVEANFPAELNQLFKGLENKGNPWNMSASARMDWAKGLDFDVPVVGESIESLDEVDWLFWVGCAGAYEDRAKKTTRAVAELLNIAGISFGVLGNGETCTGDPARRAGNEFVFQGLAMQNVETFKEYKVKKVVSTCAHCFNTLRNEYKEFGIELEVVHHTQLLNRLVREGKLTPVKEGAGAAKRSITYHDPCYLGRHNQVYSPPRELLQVLPGAEYVEMERNSEKSFCCGAGGARMWMEETLGERINVNRTNEAVGTGADQIAVGCPFCRVMLADGLTAVQAKGEAREEVEVLDVAQMLLSSIKGEQATKAAPGSSAKAAAAAGAGTAAAGGAAAGSTESGETGQPAEAKAAPSEGSSLFDAAPQTEAAPSSGSSLFDTPAESAAPASSESDTAQAQSGGSLFDTPADNAGTETATAPAEKPAAVGSLFDLGGDETPAAPAAGGSAEKPTDAGTTAAAGEPAGSDLGTGGSLFDIAESPAEPAGSDDTPAPEAPATPDAKAAPAAPAAPTAPSAPATESGQDLNAGGSLFDIAAAEPTPAPAAPAAEAAPAEAEPAAPAESTEAAADEVAPVDTAPTEQTGQTGTTGQASTPGDSIPEGGSLFDIAAPEPTPAPVAPAPVAPAAEAAPQADSADSADAADSAAPVAEETEQPAAAQPVEEPVAETPTADTEPTGTTEQTGTTGLASTPGDSIPESGSLFDIAVPEPTPTPAAPAAAPAAADPATPEPEPIAEPTPKPEPEPDSVSEPEPEPEPVDQSPVEVEQAQESEEKPATGGSSAASSGSGHTPRTDVDINESGSLFDL